MRRIVKSEAPSPLCEAKQKGWNWNEFVTNDHDGYIDCRNRARADQGDVCGYTELPLNSKGVTVHLDHFRKKSIFDKLTFDWNNLVCAAKDQRFGADYKDDRVDGKNAMSVYSNILNPVVDEAQDYFYYDTNGLIYPDVSLDIDRIEKAKRTIEIFNLNETELVSRRRALISGVQACATLSEEDIRSAFSGSGFPTVLDQEIRQLAVTSSSSSET